MTEPEVRIALPPVSYGIDEVTGPDGKKQLVVQFQTIYGIQAYPFDPNKALDFAGKIRSKAKELNSGLTVVRHDNQGVVDLSTLKDG